MWHKNIGAGIHYTTSLLIKVFCELEMLDYFKMVI